MGSPPILSKPVPGENLYIYLAMSDLAMSSVLIREEDIVQKHIYYMSHALLEAKTRYPMIEKMALALMVSAKKLRPYFQVHMIVVLTNQPLRQVMQKLEASGRLVQWAVELGEHDIQYQPRKTIKGQAAANFVVEFTNIGSERKELTMELCRPGSYMWMVHQIDNEVGHD